MSISSFFDTIGGTRASAIVMQQHGLHARPSAAIAKLTSKTELPLYFTSEAGTKNVRGSILSILQMCIGQGSKLKIEAPKNYPKDIFQNVMEIITAPNTDICHKFMSVVELAKY